MESKRLGLLHEIAPKVELIGVLLNPNNPFFDNQLKDLNDASRALGVKIQVQRASKEDEIANAFKAFEQQHAGAVLVGADPYFFGRRSLLIDPAMQLRIPAIYEWREFTEEGGLMSYGTNLKDSFRQSGGFVARILKGESPSDLPVVQSTKFEFVINLKTARHLNIAVPPGLSARADDILE
jgi:putative ABC transport system substrate-binding protein